MTRLPFSAAIKEIGQRNADVAASYRDCAKRLPPGPVSRLAASMAQQRLELGSVLGSITASPSLPEAEVEFEVSPSHLLGGDAFGPEAFDGTVIGLGDLLRKMAAAESADHEFLAAAAGAILPLSPAIAESLAGEADSARKRSIWAQDHLELLSMM